MLEKIRLIVLSALCIAVSAAAFLWVYAYFRKPAEMTLEPPSRPGLQTEILAARAGELDKQPQETPAGAENAEAEASETPPMAETLSLSSKIGRDTMIVYEYYYPNENRTQRATQAAPQSMQELTREQLIRKLRDWQIVSFSDKEVVLRRNMDDGAKKYVLGVWEGYIAVFYSDSDNMESLKEITDTPVSALSEEEQDKLTRGITVEGEEDLMKILEDYGS